MYAIYGFYEYFVFCSLFNVGKQVNMMHLVYNVLLMVTIGRYYKI